MFLFFTVYIVRIIETSFLLITKVDSNDLILLMTESNQFVWCVQHKSLPPSGGSV